MKITFRNLNNEEKEFKQLHKWCSQEFIYEWFEQKKLSYEEIETKYKNKLNNKKQELLIIQCDGIDIGYTQIYKYDDEINIKNIKNLYEFDLYIGEEKYLSKGIGTIIVKEITNLIYSKYNANGIILRPFKRNIRAIKCYEKCNYKIIDEYKGTDTVGTPEMITVLLNEKELILRYGRRI